MRTAETLPGGLLCFTSENHPITTDSVLLARFAAENLQSGRIKTDASVCDLGSGSGYLLLSLLDAGLGGRAVGVELSAEGTELLRGALNVNELLTAEAVQADLRSYKSPLQFDMVITNPPYYAAGALPANAVRAICRHEVNASPDDVCAAAARLLKDGGRFMLCYPPSRLQSLFAALRQHNLAPRVLQLVRSSLRAKPWLALLDARKARGEELHILPDLIPAQKAHRGG